jgi:tetraacyldisaccharide 4'-kinase
VLNAVSSIYGAAMGWRRQWYEHDAARQRRLSRPVVSVGNLRAGGSGKTPTVACLARLLAGRGERPAVLTRGYGRRTKTDGVTIVSDGQTIRAGVDTAGDEPLMLARALPGIPVLVCADRYRSGRLAEEQFGATVHLLDDGFQHLRLARDVDLLLVSEDDLADRLLPAGHLREPLASAARADALLVTVHGADDAARVGLALGVSTTFAVPRTIGSPTVLSTGERVAPTADRPVFAVAGVARPERFFGDLRDAGWRVCGTLAFRDHHRFVQRDVDRIAALAGAAGAAMVLTTEKDLVRLAACDVSGLPLASVPLSVSIEPADRFADWLCGRLAAAPGARNARP